MDEKQEQRGSPTADPSRASTWSLPPSWLLVPPTASDVPPPVQTRLQLLPIGSLTWEDFERLCLRLLELDTELVHVSATNPAVEATMPATGLYGRRGQAQFGIDVYARDRLVLGETPPLRRYVSLQARRIKTATKGELSSSVDEFLKGQWADVSHRFVYATSSSATSTELVDEIEKLSDQLVQVPIEFEVWDQEAISRKLKDYPELVDDFFGRPWVESFCGGTAAKALSTRLDARQVTDLRRELARIYAATFGVADSGLIAFRYSGTHPVGLLDRFVTPDLVSTTPQTAALSQPWDGQGQSSIDDHDLQTVMEEAAAFSALVPDDDAWLLRSSAWQRRHVEDPLVLERRSADQWIGTEPLQVIVGDPGAGKSTLLRYLVLDLLSKEPTWRAVAERWGQCLPIWLPFHFFTQRVAGQTGAPASVGEAIRAWLEQHDAGGVWSLVQAALDDNRLLLVVDGLDEWVNDEAGRYAVAALEAFASSHSTPLVVSTRPYGIARLTLSVGWVYTRIAPLTPEQQRLLASHYFRAVVDTDSRPFSPDVMERSVDGFLSQVRDAPDLRAISGTPLFLVLLVGLHLSNVARLPVERFDVYSQAVQLLIADHPAKRRVAAAVTASRQRLSDRQLRALLAKIAFVSQVRGDVSTLQEAVLREDFIVALGDPKYLAMNTADATGMADQLLDIAEGELGLLVRKGPAELGFLHRMLQEQLAAEYVSDQIESTELSKLFADHVGDSRWREVILATMWRLSRPSELSDLVEVIRKRIDETPAGLRTREILAEVTFGAYGLPAVDIQRSAPEIIEVIETHPYGPHRARLLDSVLAGLSGVATGDIVRECLERWTLLVQEPSDELVQEIAQLPAVESLSETACKLLLMALRYPYSRIAYASAIAIASRCSRGGPGIDGERGLLRTELLRILSDPPSGLAQAAALIALALEWRDDPLVVDVLNEARGHTDESVRIVAFGDALGVLRTTFANEPTEPTRYTQQLSDVEREWLIGRLRTPGLTDTHPGLLLAVVAEAARGQHSVLEDLVEGLKSESGPYRTYDDLIWPVTLNVLANDHRVVDIVCAQLRSKEHSRLSLKMGMGDEQLLAPAYPPESPHNGRVAAAIEDRLSTFKTKIRDRELWGLAAVDRGPMMKEALLEDLRTGPWPHWAAEALAKYFVDDTDVGTALHSMLMGDSVRASMIANAATRVLARGEVIPRLLAILRDLAGAAHSRGRYDIVAAAMIQACQEEGFGHGLEVESVAAEALRLMPSTPGPLFGDPRHSLAAALYPSTVSREALAELAEVTNRPIAPYLRAFRHDPEQVLPSLVDASRILRSLPAYLRARVCQSLADRAITPDVVLHLTRRWADEVSPLNKSTASLAYHRALLRAREERLIDDEQWNLALVHLGEQSSCYGFDHEARRRSAWVGVCVCGDWSILKGRVEPNVQSSLVSVRLPDPLHGPDRILLQQLASRWDDLRSEFGDTLLARLSGISQREPKNHVWDALALVAARNAMLQQELESAVANDPELLKLDGILVWFVTRGNTGTDGVIDALVSGLQNDGRRRERPASFLVAESERIGLPRGGLRGRLENALRRVPLDYGDPVLEALALLFPEHPVVRNAWQEISALIAGRRSSADHPVHAQTYFALAYAAVDSSEIFKQIERDLDRLDEIGETYADNALTRHVSHRLRRDAAAAGVLRDAVMSPATPDSRAATLLSFLADAGGLDEGLLLEVERRITVQNNVRLAPVVRDRAASANLSVRTIFTRVADAAWDLLAI